MARRRVLEPPARADPASREGIPPELGVGRLIEIWAEPGVREWMSAWRGWDDARTAWLQVEGLADHRGHPDWHAVKRRFGGILTGGAPWSIRTLDDEGRGAYVDERLSRAGVRREDVPELRRRALARLAELPRTAG